MAESKTVEVVNKPLAEENKTKPVVPPADETYRTPPEKKPISEVVNPNENEVDMAGKTKHTFPKGTVVFAHDGVVFRSTETITAIAEVGEFDDDQLAGMFVAGGRPELLSGLKGKWSPQGNKIEKPKAAKSGK